MLIVYMYIYFDFLWIKKNFLISGRIKYSIFILAKSKVLLNDEWTSIKTQSVKSYTKEIKK